MTIEQILKLRGWSDADITAVAATWTPKMREDIEASYGAVATERDTLKAKDEAWQRQLDEQWQPRVNAVEKEAQDARREAARLSEELKIAKDYGYITPEAERKAKEEIAKVEAAAAGVIDASKYVNWDDAHKLMEGEGQAIVMANDIAQEYAHLTGGKSLIEYEAVVGGRMLRGMTALREEAKASRKNLDVYVSEKFDFQGKRDAMKVQRQKEHDDAIRKEAAESTRKELAEQYGNPLLQMPRPSRAAFIPPKASDGKQPWEHTAQERRSARIQRAMETQMKGAGVQ